MRFYRLVPLAFAGATVVACSLANAPSDPAPAGAGGATVECQTLSDCVAPSCRTAKECDLATHTCVYQQAGNGSVCDDGLGCTQNDVCLAGVCTGQPRSCTPSDDCHEASCDEATNGCVETAAPDGGTCDDGDPCTATSTCAAGACVSGPPCPGTECRTSTCTATGCVDQNVLAGTPCGNTQCTAGSCDGAGNCSVTPINIGGPCDDGDFCTTSETCDGGGQCTNAQPTCQNNPATPCLTAGCDAANATCTFTAVPNGTVCDDSDACTANTSCQNGACTGSAITSCAPGDGCCPAGCSFVNDADCLFWASGVQQNVDPAALAGWTLCYDGNYAQTFPVANILAACPGSNLLLACRKFGEPTYRLAAMAPRADVLFDCGTQTNCTHQSNGVGWYFSDVFSWGFAAGGDSVYRNSCDYNGGGPQANPSLRMCWHSGGGNLSAGYRCGDDGGPGAAYDATWERVVYSAN